MILTLDHEALDYETGKSRNLILQSGLYKGRIESAKELVSSKGARGIKLEFIEDENNQRAIFHLYLVSAKGKPTKMRNRINAICFVCEVDTDFLLPKLMMTKELDFKRKVYVDVERRFYEPLHGKKLALEIKAKKYYPPNGKNPKMNYEIIDIFNYETMQTASQMRDNLPAVIIENKEQ